MPEDKDRLQREIEEILNRIDDFPAEAARIRAKHKRASRGPSLRQRLAGRLSNLSLSASRLMVTGIALVLLSYFIVGRFLPVISRWGIIIGLVLFLGSFALSLWPRPSASPQVEKRWRGRIIDNDSAPERAGWRERVRRWRSKR